MFESFGNFDLNYTLNGIDVENIQMEKMPTNPNLDRVKTLNIRFG